MRTVSITQVADGDYPFISLEDSDGYWVRVEFTENDEKQYWISELEGDDEPVTAMTQGFSEDRCLEAALAMLGFLSVEHLI